MGAFDVFGTGSSGVSDYSPIYPTIQETMNVNLAVNEKGQIWVLHDKQFPCVLNWAEYDADLRTMTLMSHEGYLLGLGMKIQTPIHNLIVDSREIYTILLYNNDIADFYIMPLIVRNTSAAVKGE